MKTLPTTLLTVTVLFFGSMIAGIANAGYIEGSSICSVLDVTATGYLGPEADNCVGLLDKDPGAANDSEGLLNNALSLDGGTGVWDANGAFGSNDWNFLGKDEHTTQNFIDVASGNPSASWTVDTALTGNYIIAVKQGQELGLWNFNNLMGVTAGTLFMDRIFGDGFTDDAWSHVSIYGTSTSVPEPSIIALFGLGLIGLGFARRRKHS